MINSTCTKILLFINIFFVVMFFSSFIYTKYIMIDSVSRITELDRAGVIDEEKLREFDPNLAIYTRTTLGFWVSAGERQTARKLAVTGMALSGSNLLLACIILLCQSKRCDRVKQSGMEKNGDSEGDG